MRIRVEDREKHDREVRKHFPASVARMLSPTKIVWIESGGRVASLILSPSGKLHFVINKSF